MTLTIVLVWIFYAIMNNLSLFTVLKTISPHNTSETLPDYVAKHGNILKMLHNNLDSVIDDCSYKWHTFKVA